MKLLKERFGYIYKITNKINSKIYIGKTNSSIDIRFKQHIYSIEHHKTKSLLYDAMKKYGIENFTIEEIDSADSLEELNKKERHYISKYESQNPNIGYNICKGGECGPGGPMFKDHHHSEETKRKMSFDRTGTKNSNYGNRWHHTSDMKYRYDGENNPMFGKTHSEDSKFKNRLSHLNSKKMTNDEIYPNYKMIKEKDIEEYLNNGWYFFKKK